MGCDIHQKTFIWSNVEGRMVPAMGIFDEDSRRVPEIVGYRSYDLFGLFGNSARSNYPELDCFEGEEFPDFMNNLTCGAIFCDDQDAHTRRWCWLDKLKKSMLEFEVLLHHPREYEKKYGGFDEFFMPNIKTMSVKQFETVNSGLISNIKWTVGMIDAFKKEMDHFVALNRLPNTPVPEPVDSSKIALVTWMDS